MNESSLLYAGALGVLQGLTEFLPVSSSGHLIVLSWLLDGRPLPLELNIALHVGTMAAVLIYFWRDWLRITAASWLRLTKGQRSFEADTLVPAILVGSIPAGVVGILWEHQIEDWFHHPSTVVLPLAIIGIVLWQVDSRCRQTRSMERLSIGDGFLIGVAQACALIPGFSRSGSTMIAARALNFCRHDAARFSFLLGTPAMAGAALLHIRDLIASISNPTFLVGVTVSAAVGCLAIRFFLGFIQKFGFKAFAYYRLAVAASILVLIALRA